MRQLYKGQKGTVTGKGVCHEKNTGEKCKDRAYDMRGSFVESVFTGKREGS